MCVKNHYFLRFEAFLPLGRIWINRHKVLSVWLSKDDFITKQLMKHENNYFTRIFLIFFVGKKKGHIFAPSKMTLSMIVPLCNGSTAGFGSVSQGSNPCGTTTPAGGNKERRSPLLLYRNTTHLLLSKRDSVIGCHTRWWRANRQEVDTDCPMV